MRQTYKDLAGACGVPQGYGGGYAPMARVGADAPPWDACTPVPGWSGCENLAPICPPVRCPTRICPMMIGVDVTSGIGSGEHKAFTVKVDTWFKLKTLLIASNVAMQLCVDSIIVHRTEQLGTGTGTGALPGNAFSELSACCPQLSCDIAFPDQIIKVTVHNFGADLPPSDEEGAFPCWLTLIGEGLE